MKAAGNIGVGVTGGIGCGKSIVCRELHRLFGARIIDVDLAGRKAVDDHPAVQQQILQTFGNEVFAQPGKLDRRKLGRIVFADPLQRQQLNRIVHPVMLNMVRQEIALARQEESPVPYFLVDAALIFELALDRELSFTVIVHAPLDICLERTHTRDRLTDDEIRQRIAAQLPLQEKMRRADFVVDNSGSLEILQQQVRKLHAWLIEMAA